MEHKKKDYPVNIYKKRSDLGTWQKKKTARSKIVCLDNNILYRQQEIDNQISDLVNIYDEHRLHKVLH